MWIVSDEMVDMKGIRLGVLCKYASTSSMQSHDISFTMMQVQKILTCGEGPSHKAVGVKLADGRVFRGKSIISNATRWDTFEKMMGGEERLPPSEKAFRSRYKKSPSFISIHMGVKASAIPAGKIFSRSSAKRKYRIEVSFGWSPSLDVGQGISV